MTTKNKVEAYTRKYKLTAEQVKALKAVYGNGWTKLSQKAIELSLATMGK